MEFPNVLAQQNAHADYVHLLESISAVLGATRLPKADLLEEPTSSGGISHSVSGHVQVWCCGAVVSYGGALYSVKCLPRAISEDVVCR